MRQFALTLLLVSLAMSAALSSAVADEPGKCEKTEVRAILKSEKPREMKLISRPPFAASTSAEGSSASMVRAIW